MDISPYSSVVIEDSKIREYLLNLRHPEGSTKAEYFIHHGFDPNQPGVFKDFLLMHLQHHSTIAFKETLFGTKYILGGRIKAADGNEITLRAIWMKPRDENILKFVTAYPVEP